MSKLGGSNFSKSQATNKSLAFTLQLLIDKNKDTSKLMLILCR